MFRAIRARFNINAADYLLCVCGNFQVSNTADNHLRVRADHAVDLMQYLEFISNSKSGQFFFYSHDRRYMIKTVSSGECKLLRQILPSYYAVNDAVKTMKLLTANRIAFNEKSEYFINAILWYASC